MAARSFIKPTGLTVTRARDTRIAHWRGPQSTDRTHNTRFAPLVVSASGRVCVSVCIRLVVQHATTHMRTAQHA